MNTYDAVFFISFGGPEKSEDIMPFLETVTRGRNIPRARLEDVAHHYEAMGGRSPINEITRRQGEALEQLLHQQGVTLPLFIGQRNWHPFIEDTLKAMIQKGVKHAVGFITAAHRCEASLERYIKAVEAARAAIGPTAPIIDYVDPWFDHPLFIDAIAARVKEVIKDIPADRLAAMPWLFTAHSIPCSMAKESTYVQELQRTAEAVCRKVGRREFSLAYSSRSGNPSDPWLEPDVCDVIQAEAKRGAKEILFIPIGFVADHVEVLFDLDVEAQEAAQEAGVTLRRTQTVGEHPLFVKAMAEIIRQRMTKPEQAVQRDSHSTVHQDGTPEIKVGTDSPVCYCQPNSSTPPCRRVAVAR